MNPSQNIILESSYAGPGQMHKAQQVVQQGVNIKTVHDKQGALSREGDIKARRGMFQVNDPRMFTVAENQLLYYFDDLPSFNPDGERLSLPCLNGAGRYIDENYRDPETRRLALRSLVHFAGISVRGFDPNEPAAQQSHTLQIHGTRTIQFDGDIPPGAYVQMEIPLESDFTRGKYTSLISRGNDIPQARCIVNRYNPDSISSRFVTARNAALADPDKFARAFNPLGGNGLDHAFKAHFESQLLSMILGFYNIFSDAGRWKLATGNTVIPGPLASAKERAEAATAICNRLAVGLGIVKNNINSGVLLTPEEAKNFVNLEQQILNTINWTGLINFAYSGTPLQKNAINALNQIDRKPEYSPVESQIAALAYNHGQRAVAAYNKFVEWDTQNIIGICTKGANAGSNGEILILY